MKKVFELEDDIMYPQRVISKLMNVKNYIRKSLSNDDLQTLSNYIHSLNSSIKGDGAGLSSGFLVDKIISDFFKKKIYNYSPYYEGEGDMKLLDHPLSLKKINGKSTIALDWSKNIRESKRNYFNCDMLIINLKTDKWWKNKEDFTDLIESGIYLIDKEYCKKNVLLNSNNKTNTLIESEYLYNMLKYSKEQSLFLSIPTPSKKLNFSILDSFVE